MDGIKVVGWLRALTKLRTTFPDSAPPAYWRWTLSCMAATSKRGARGHLSHSDLRVFLRCANASGRLTVNFLDNTLKEITESDQRLGLLWGAKRPSPAQKQSLTTRQATGLLMRLCTSSSAITDLFDRFGVGGRIGTEEYLQFVHEEQMQLSDGRDREDGTSCSNIPWTTSLSSSPSDLNPADRFELMSAERWFQRALEKTGNGEHGDRVGLDQLQFALQLLSPHNDVVDPTKAPAATETFLKPLAHYWTACSHNSYLIGDQLTGQSSPDMYRRLLLQV